MTGRSYASFVWLCVLIVVLVAFGYLSYSRDADLIAQALHTIAFFLALHLPESWRNARAHAHRAQPLPAIDSTP
ncbi:hypothetical protein ABQW67_19760 [Xanthomonas hortorum]|uniref:hypothetical protein n=1 Tax=Xanthomonas hortorum TaxID=56454 RepID=UPI0015D5AC78|nr:hypothetical protein [Xanthomonas hortorum]MCC8492386.1 hypothetical protein [Xanthomonas hortorum pv. gardneri]MCE4343959.1 hypothetical protein [Xanthomonas hortorum pv. vitians]MCE4530972.1 hypothetical protein [Xanthomonas hortorum pv. vitians]NMI20072.1 hypothetical protein [Xanthomonas hortorum pv. vitians]